MTDKRVKVVFYTAPKVKARIEAAAKAAGVSVSAFVTMAVLNAIDRK